MDEAKKIAARGVFTTGQIARLMGVGPRTVVGWIDTGRLKGYRIPRIDGKERSNGYDPPCQRRVIADDLRKFAIKAGFPMVGDISLGVLLVSMEGSVLPAVAAKLRASGGPKPVVVNSMFEAGYAIKNMLWVSVVIDTAHGLRDSAAVATAASSELANYWKRDRTLKRRVVVLLPEDGVGKSCFADAVTMVKPASARSVVEAVEANF